jgi:hypothetical protein
VSDEVDELHEQFSFGTPEEEPDETGPTEGSAGIVSTIRATRCQKPRGILLVLRSGRSEFLPEGVKA